MMIERLLEQTLTIPNITSDHSVPSAFIAVDKIFMLIFFGVVFLVPKNNPMRLQPWLL